MTLAFGLYAQLDYTLEAIADELELARHSPQTNKALPMETPCPILYLPTYSPPFKRQAIAISRLWCPWRDSNPQPFP